jgi:protein-disulfide isomerase
MIKKHFWKIFAVAAVVLIGGAFAYGQYVSNAANEGIVIEDHIKGNPEGRVVLTKHSDFQCPACAQFATVVDEVLASYGQYIRFEYKHFPLINIHPNAVPAARAAEAAGQQGQFYAMHDALFTEQRAWGQSPNPQVFFNQYAENIGLDVDLFKTHMKASVLRDEVMAGFNEARELGLTGTPTSFLNGERMVFQTYEEFLEQIEAAVAAEYDIVFEVNPEEAGMVEASVDPVEEEVSIDTPVLQGEVTAE